MFTEQVAQVALYMKACLANDIATVLTFVANDISFTSPKYILFFMPKALLTGCSLLLQRESSGQSQL